MEKNDEINGRTLMELFEKTIPALGAFAVASKSMSFHNPSRFQMMPKHLENSYDPRSYLPIQDRAYIDLMNDAFKMLQRAHHRANIELQPIGIRYEVDTQNQINNLFHLTTSIPDMISVSVQLRDVGMVRRLPQVVRYRISLARRHKGVSLTVMDDKLKMVPAKVRFKVDPHTQEFELRSFEDGLVDKLIARARSAFKR